MRSLLDALYKVTAFLAAASLLTIALLILAQVLLRALGIQLKSADDIAGYALVGTTILGLAPTYRYNTHIRVSLLIDRFPLGSGARRLLERLIAAGACLLVGWAAWVSTVFVVESYQYNEMSQGLLAIPLFIPQSLMALGFIVFFVALLDDLIVDLAGGVQSHLAVAACADDMPIEH